MNARGLRSWLWLLGKEYRELVASRNNLALLSEQLRFDTLTPDLLSDWVASGLDRDHVLAGMLG